MGYRTDFAISGARSNGFARDLIAEYRAIALTQADGGSRVFMPPHLMADGESIINKGYPAHYRTRVKTGSDRLMR
jgi:hypothetical protein